MKNENTPAEGKDSEQLEAESALRGAACCACSFWELYGGAEPEENTPSSEDERWGRCNKGVGIVSQYPEPDMCIGDGRPEDGTGSGRTGPYFGCVHFLHNSQADRPQGSV